MRSPARMEKVCSHAGPRLDGADSARSTVAWGRDVRRDPSGSTVTSSASLRSTQAPSARSTSMGWAWTSGTGHETPASRA